MFLEYSINFIVGARQLWLPADRTRDYALNTADAGHIVSNGTDIAPALSPVVLYPSMGGLSPPPVVYGNLWQPEGGVPRSDFECGHTLPPLQPSVKCVEYINLTAPSQYLPCADTSVSELQLCVVDDQASLRDQFGVYWRETKPSRRPLYVNNGALHVRDASAGVNLFM
jgi:hypothetical protein